MRIGIIAVLMMLSGCAGASTAGFLAQGLMRGSQPPGSYQSPAYQPRSYVYYPPAQFPQQNSTSCTTWESSPGYAQTDCH